MMGMEEEGKENEEPEEIGTTEEKKGEKGKKPEKNGMISDSDED